MRFQCAARLHTPGLALLDPGPLLRPDGGETGPLSCSAWQKGSPEKNPLDLVAAI